MPRPLRCVVPGQPHHVIQRGNNKSPIFAARADYTAFYAHLIKVCDRHSCSVHAYVFMTNHIHLLITPRDAQALSSMMQSLGRHYVRYFNDCHGRTGTLWEGRFRASMIESERYLLTCYQYVELNPVRSGQVVRPENYEWSSYCANALGLHDPLVSPHDRYVALGRDTASRCAAYRALFQLAADTSTLNDIRESTNRGWPLGNDRFREQVTALLGRRVAPLVRGGDRKSEAYRVASRDHAFH